MPDLLIDADHLRRLLLDLERIRAGECPTGTELMEAPVLEAWRACLMPSLEPVLTGEVSGHPLLTGHRREIVTSRVVAIDAGCGWARTWNRWYRLRRPTLN